MKRRASRWKKSRRPSVTRAAVRRGLERLLLELVQEARLVARGGRP